MSEITLPIVDIAPFLSGSSEDKIRVARSFGNAFETVGFAVIVGHGVPEELLTETYDVMTRFFDEPLETKLSYSPPEKTKGRGYLPMGIESVAKTLSGETPPDLCEALVFAAPHHEDELDRKHNFYPTNPSGLTDLVSHYTGEMVRLNADLMRLSALALDLPEDYFDSMYADPALTLRFVNYPDQEDEPLPGQLRYGEHHDYGAITILRQDAAPGGLQVRDFDGIWKEARVVPRSFVINVGDLLSRWTNDRWRSTLHRVSNPSRKLTGSTRRLSMVAFTGPSADTLVTAIQTCVAPENPAKYEPVNAGDYIMAKIRASHEIGT
ncbi:2-oxoglutarate and iron-dependent oxygenase domain-containing protein [Hyphomicrobium sp. CS1GBMeth3]|uniref:isopenicillin N synthase family dioxygenase n=1 Tax=Hyphomicrobium sp. CS1GBMeth3 TaxID=1892845 RepID=UPI000930D903|nr:2-oxoglutarate and iron-dependent oxygenase domain-containing protein [Hyphomicrobium sp. CS1GBMeth3]